MNEAILHSDLNSFYASVEMMLEPSLRGKAVAVCGSTEERHGIVLAKSEKAKRTGVKTGMVNWEARRVCPDLIIVPPQYDKYLKYSKLTHEIYERYTDLIEPYGMDECWLDVGGSGIYGTPLQIAEKIRKNVREELGLTVSVGVSFNKVFAKLGSDMKKPDAVTVITRENFRDKVWRLPASDMLYVGRATQKKLSLFEINTIGELASLQPELLKMWFGVGGISLWKSANGLDTSHVMHKDFVSPVKSVGHGITCIADLTDSGEVWRVMLELCQDIGHKLRVHELTAECVQITIKGNDLCTCQFQERLAARTQLPSLIAAKAFKIFSERYNWRTPVRAVTVCAADLVSVNEARQLSILDDTVNTAVKEKIQDAVETIRERYGKRAITYGALVGDMKLPGTRSHDIAVASGMRTFGSYT